MTREQILSQLQTARSERSWTLVDALIQSLLGNNVVPRTLPFEADPPVQVPPRLKAVPAEPVTLEEFFAPVVGAHPTLQALRSSVRAQIDALLSRLQPEVMDPSVWLEIGRIEKWIREVDGSFEVAPPKDIRVP